MRGCSGRKVALEEKPQPLLWGLSASLFGEGVLRIQPTQRHLARPFSQARPGHFPGSEFRAERRLSLKSSAFSPDVDRSSIL